MKHNKSQYYTLVINNFSILPLHTLAFIVHTNIVTNKAFLVNTESYDTAEQIDLSDS